MEQEPARMKALMERIRSSLSEKAWSAAVRLARQNRVLPAGEDVDEVRLSVSVPGREPAVTVYLWPQEVDWGCDCGHEACVHAGAAILSLVHARKQEEESPSGSGAPRLRYALVRGQGGLRVLREVVRGEEAQPLSGSLSAVPGLHVRSQDLEVDQVLQLGDGNIPGVGWKRMLMAWVDAGSEITLDGEPMRVSDRAIAPVAVVADDEDGFRVSLHRSMEIDEVFPGGVVRLCDTLHPGSDGGLVPHQRKILVQGLRFAPEEVGQLVAEFIPQLESMIDVRIRTNRLPDDVQRIPPHAEVWLEDAGHFLRVRVGIVYGDPPIARVEGASLVLLGGQVPVRDLAAEQTLREELDRVLRLPLGREITLEGEEGALFARNRLPRFKGTISGDVGRFRPVERDAVLSLNPAAGPLGLRIHCDADPEDLLAAFQDQRSLVRLRDGGWAPIPRALLERHGHLLADLLGAAGSDGSLPAHAAGPAAELSDALGQERPDALQQLRGLVDGFEGIPHVPPPASLTATLRPYQEAGIRWMCWLGENRLGGILADDMGLGKTLQALCALAHLGGPSLVVAPTSVLRAWEREAARFLPQLKVCIYHGAQRTLDPSADLVVTTYALLRLDNVLQERDWNCVVLDESQAIKNPDSQTARAARGLKANHRFALTGTPVENRLEELQSQLDFLMPGFLGTRKGFQERFARPIEQGDKSAGEALRRRIRPFVLRRLKSEVARALPPRTEVVLRCELPPDQRAVYQTVQLAAREKARELVDGHRTLEALEHLLRLRQAACHPALLPGDRTEASGKMDLLMEKLIEVVSKGHRALVFSQWTSFLDLIEQELERRGQTALRLDGSTRDRQGLVDRFQADDGPPIFLISLKAGGTGLTLTRADYVFHTDPWWNPAVEDQATDRAHRIGQTRPVISVKLISADTVEERIVELQAAKRALAAVAIGDEQGLVERLGRAELLELLEG
jgi:superfamily II DNA or RNA helicase